MKVLQRFGLTALILCVLAIGPTVARATPIPLGGGGVINMSNISGDLVAVSSNPPCIAFSGNTATCSGTTPMLVSGTDPIFGTSGTIKDISTSSIVAFKSAVLTVAGGPA